VRERGRENHPRKGFFDLLLCCDNQGLHVIMNSNLDFLSFLCGHLWDTSQPFAYVSKLSLQLKDHLPLSMSFPVTLETINEQNKFLFCYFLHHSNHKATRLCLVPFFSTTSASVL
jgi:hypothetical protein